VIPTRLFRKLFMTLIAPSELKYKPKIEVSISENGIAQINI
jgi:hypothetical protein